ncbi:MAG: hypothetical protein ACXW2O_04175, partial [Candidatus Aminicenantales bacterium]
VFYEPPEPIALSACAYLHNYRFIPNETLLQENFTRLLEAYPHFSMDDVEPLSDFLKARLQGGSGMDILGRIEDGRIGAPFSSSISTVMSPRTRTPWTC